MFNQLKTWLKTTDKGLTTEILLQNGAKIHKKTKLG